MTPTVFFDGRRHIDMRGAGAAGAGGGAGAGGAGRGAAEAGLGWLRVDSPGEDLAGVRGGRAEPADQVTPED